MLSFCFISGDVLSGVCFVGHLDARSLGIFLLLPLCTYLALGALFLLAGFVSLFRIRTVMKSDGKRTDKLERLMMRIGFFSALFVLPAVGFCGCLFYEYRNLDAWMVQWNRDMCKVFSIPCPTASRLDADGVSVDGGESRPYFQVFMLKYVCSMLVGVTSSVWLYSGKTVVSWRLFIERLRGDAAGPGGHLAACGAAGEAAAAAAPLHRQGGVGGNENGGGGGGGGAGGVPMGNVAGGGGVRGGGGGVGGEAARTRGTAYV